MVKTLAELRATFVEGYSPTSQDLTNFMDTMQANGGPIPVGTIVRAGSIAPGGTIRCDGSLLSTTTYADLYAKIGEQFSYRMNNGMPWSNQWGLNYVQNADITGWTTGTSLPGTLNMSSVIVTNSRVYLLGGNNGAAAVATVYTAPINSDGTLGTWTTGTSIPGALANSCAIVTNSRVYLIGGSNVAAAVSTVYTAPINADGTLGTWIAATSLPGPLAHSSVAVTNNRVYIFSGRNASAWVNTCYTAPINPDGTLGAWAGTTGLPGVLGNSSAIVTNNRVYVLAGNSGSGGATTVYTAPINSDGTLGAWGSSAALPGTIAYSSVVATNSRVYVLGGFSAAVVATVYTAPINGDGTLGIWTTGTSLPAGLQNSTVIVTNSKVYLLGGSGATVYTASFAGGINNYMNKSYVAVPGTGQFRLPDLSQDDLRRPGLYSYIKY